jgi:hypothetical protein
MKFFALSAAILLSVCLPAWADAFLLGHDLQSKLQNEQTINEGRATLEQGMDYSVASGYVLGVSDSLNGVAFCVPSQATKGQMVAIVIKYLNDHPDRWQYTAHSLVKDALLEAFPCGRK